MSVQDENVPRMMVKTGGVPPQVEIAIRMLAYCRSLADPPSMGNEWGGRGLTTHERGLEIACLNLLRDFVNGERLAGELEFCPVPVQPEAENGHDEEPF